MHQTIDTSWFKSPEFVRRVLITLLALVAYRIGLNLPLPGINPAAVQQTLAASGSSFMGTLYNSSTIARLSIMGLGIMPLLGALSLFELARIAVPPLRRWLDERPARLPQALNLVALAALVMAILQAAGIASSLENFRDLVPVPGMEFRIGIIVALTGGTAVAIALARVIDWQGLGQGLWLILASGYAVDVLRMLVQTFQVSAAGQPSALPFVAVLLYYGGAIMLIVILTGAKAGTGRSGHRSLNPGGVWPIILAGLVAPWFFIPAIWIPSLAGGASFLYWFYAASIAMMLVFCWLYERAQHDMDVQDKPPQGRLIRALMPAGIYIVITLAVVMLKSGLRTPFVLGATSLVILVVALQTALRAPENFDGRPLTNQANPPGPDYRPIARLRCPPPAFVLLCRFPARRQSRQD